MTDKKIDNWTDYWHYFNNLIKSLNDDQKTSCISELRDAQMHVNGMTDGWFEFLIAFEKTINKFRTQLTDSQIKEADLLTAFLGNILKQK